MKIEIVEFYPTVQEVTPKNAILLGTMHIYVCDADLDIRGINCILNKKGKIECYLPSRTVRDDKGQATWIPFVSFTNPKNRSEMLKFLKKDCTEFVRKYIDEKMTRKV